MFRFFSIVLIFTMVATTATPAVGLRALTPSESGVARSLSNQLSSDPGLEDDRPWLSATDPGLEQNEKPSLGDWLLAPLGFFSSMWARRFSDHERAVLGSHFRFLVASLRNRRASDYERVILGSHFRFLLASLRNRRASDYERAILGSHLRFVLSSLSNRSLRSFLKKRQALLEALPQPDSSLNPLAEDTLSGGFYYQAAASLAPDNVMPGLLTQYLSGSHDSLFIDGVEVSVAEDGLALLDRYLAAASLNRTAVLRLEVHSPQHVVVYTTLHNQDVSEAARVLTDPGLEGEDRPWLNTTLPGLEGDEVQVYGDIVLDNGLIPGNAMPLGSPQQVNASGVLQNYTTITMGNVPLDPTGPVAGGASLTVGEQVIRFAGAEVVPGQPVNVTVGRETAYVIVVTDAATGSTIYDTDVVTTQIINTRNIRTERIAARDQNYLALSATGESRQVRVSTRGGIAHAYDVATGQLIPVFAEGSQMASIATNIADNPYQAVVIDGEVIENTGSDFVPTALRAIQRSRVNRAFAFAGMSTDDAGRTIFRVTTADQDPRISQIRAWIEGGDVTTAMIGGTRVESVGTDATRVLDLIDRVLNGGERVIDVADVADGMLVVATKPGREEDDVGAGSADSALSLADSERSESVGREVIALDTAVDPDADHVASLRREERIARGIVHRQAQRWRDGRTYDAGTRARIRDANGIDAGRRVDPETAAWLEQNLSQPTTFGFSLSGSGQRSVAVGLEESVATDTGTVVDAAIAPTLAAVAAKTSAAKAVDSVIEAVGETSTANALVEDVVARMGVTDEQAVQVLSQGATAPVGNTGIRVDLQGLGVATDRVQTIWAGTSDVNAADNVVVNSMAVYVDSALTLDGAKFDSLTAQGFEVRRLSDLTPEAMARLAKAEAGDPQAMFLVAPETADILMNQLSWTSPVGIIAIQPNQVEQLQPASLVSYVNHTFAQLQATGVLVYQALQDIFTLQNLNKQVLVSQHA